MVAGQRSCYPGSGDEIHMEILTILDAGGVISTLSGTPFIFYVLHILHPSYSMSFIFYFKTGRLSLPIGEKELTN